MFIMAIMILLILVILDIKIVKICIRKINGQRYFNYFDKNTWIVLVIFGSIFGQLLYLVLENS